MHLDLPFFRTHPTIKAEGSDIACRPGHRWVMLSWGPMLGRRGWGAASGLDRHP
jgi:hypothetical protein